MGRARRFGSPKALASLGGETLAARAWRVLGEACNEIVAVGKSVDGLEFPFPLLDDGSEVRAPIAGVVAGLRAASHDTAVVLPVDCPEDERDDAAQARKSTYGSTDGALAGRLYEDDAGRA